MRERGVHSALVAVLVSVRKAVLDHKDLKPQSVRMQARPL